MKAGPILTVLSAVVFGFFIGISFPVEITPKIRCGILFPCSGGGTNSSFSDSNILLKFWAPLGNRTVHETPIQSNGTSGIQVPKNPKGAERLPPGIVVSESDLHLRRLWGALSEDAPTRKYLLTLAAGYTEKANVNATVEKFSDNFDVVLFHYDGRTTEWDAFEWSKQAVHVSARKQTKWWFAKRFLHPSIVAPYEYIFLWDEDLGVENFTAEEYISIAKKHGLEISQPGLDITRGKKTYDVTIKRDGSEMHNGLCYIYRQIDRIEVDARYHLGPVWYGFNSTRFIDLVKLGICSSTDLEAGSVDILRVFRTNAGGPGNCPDVHRRPCSGFVEVMAPVFSRDAWRCVWHMIQNDLVHGWGLDFNFWRCVDDPEEQIGVVDAKYVAHHGVPTLIAQGNGEQQGSSDKVRARQYDEMHTFDARIANADKKLSNATAAQADRHS